MVHEAADKDSLSSPEVPTCAAAPLRNKPIVEPISVKILKIMTLSGAFCLIMAVYEIFEYIFCYDDEKKAHRRLIKLTIRARELSEGGNLNENNCNMTSTSTSGQVTESTGLLSAEANDTCDSEDEIFSASNPLRTYQDQRNVADLEDIPLQTFNTQEPIQRDNTEEMTTVISNLPCDTRESSSSDTSGTFCMQYGSNNKIHANNVTLESDGTFLQNGDHTSSSADLLPNTTVKESTWDVGEQTSGQVHR